ncbi:MAG: glycosyltransferase family 1 protein [Parcubacteria group bacterium]|jgi:glycosyltransferase involved in cell wall biosynthesis
MIIGIDGSRAFLAQRTGIEEYSYQVIKHLVKHFVETQHCCVSTGAAQVVLYLRKNQKIDFALPKNWKIKVLRWPRFWTQFGLSLEMLFHPVDVLFIPAHVAPLIHPKKTFMVVHGLEYEIMKDAYSFWERIYMRNSIKLSCRWAKKIIAVSKNTKKDLIELYKVPENKIEVIYNGVNIEQKSKVSEQYKKYKPYLLFISRLEKRKNVAGIISAFEILKEKYKIKHKLVLAGRPGFGYQEIKSKMNDSEYKDEIIEFGFVPEDEKFNLIKNSEIFLFPTFYEGFGLPILEAQSLGIPVVTSNNSSLSEVGGDSVAYSTPTEPISIADSIYKIISDENFKNAIIEKGYGNVKRFSWTKCADSIAKLLSS